ncbi:MAG: TRAP transporter small permease subunit [Alphaproteobacteria bacterium]|nr:TRAP transporter small permease subunit [Alphaproteobacteria bacterium]
MDRALTAFIRGVDALNGAVGRVVGWLTVATVLVCAGVVFLRYAVKIGSVWTQELYVWIHSCVFMLGAGYTLLVDKHVRVDLWYAKQSGRTKAVVDILGAVLFLLPWVAVLLWTGIPFIARSWAILEPSAQVGGLPALFLFKTVLIAFAVLLGLQGLARAARAVLILRDRPAP